ncbi:MAG: alanine racemase [Burkholderiaceae bacterium]
MSRPALLTIHESALAHNLQQVRDRVGGSSIWAVCKARGYGLGLDSCLRGFAKAQGMAVLELAEAQTLRDAGWAGPILLLEGAFSHAETRDALEIDCDLVVHQADQLGWLTGHQSLLARQTSRLWMKFNTGMHRLGFSATTPSQRQALMEPVASLRALVAAGRRGWMTHFACADQPDGIQTPMTHWHALMQVISPQAGECLSLANSAAVLLHPDAHADWVRPGIMLYGGSPAPQMSGASSWSLEPAATLSSRLIAVQSVPSGERVGYGGRYQAKTEMRIGVVAMGYADGYMRQAPDGTPVLVDGVRCPLVGQVSMDMITVDLSACPQAKVGSPVTLWGRGLSIDEVAQGCGTNAYELLTGVTSRVARRLEPHLGDED